VTEIYSVIQTIGDQGVFRGKRSTPLLGNFSNFLGFLKKAVRISHPFKKVLHHPSSKNSEYPLVSDIKSLKAQGGSGAGISGIPYNILQFLALPW